MDNSRSRDGDFVIDLKNGSVEPKEIRKFTSLDDNFVKLSIVDPPGLSNGVLNVVIDSQMAGEKTKGKKGSSAKKPPKPPRPPPRGFSLDAADQKLINELAELAMIKWARITRMKALKQKKALKGSSSISGSLFAMLFTVIFILMILLQGTSPNIITPQRSPQTNENGLVFIQEQLNPSASDSLLPHSKSSNLFGKITGSGSANNRS